MKQKEILIRLENERRREILIKLLNEYRTESLKSLAKRIDPPLSSQTFWAWTQKEPPQNIRPFNLRRIARALGQDIIVDRDKNNAEVYSLAPHDDKMETEEDSANTEDTADRDPKKVEKQTPHRSPHRQLDSIETEYMKELRWEEGRKAYLQKNTREE